VREVAREVVLLAFEGWMDAVVIATIDKRVK